MNKNLRILIISAILSALATAAVVLSWPQAASAELPTIATSTPEVLTHQQTVWLYALEWCESRGVVTALNPKDLDGTPSYGSFQFKPGTFYYYANLYGVATSLGYRDSDSQRAIVTQMIVHGGIKWSQQFPGCTRKLGTPPKLSTKKV